jgi:hypothetical protein
LVIFTVLVIWVGLASAWVRKAWALASPAWSAADSEPPELELALDAELPPDAELALDAEPLDPQAATSTATAKPTADAASRRVSGLRLLRTVGMDPPH